MVKGDARLRKRIRYAAYKREQGDETLGDIAGEIGVGVQSIYNHVKKHMEDVSERYEARRAVYTAKKQAEVSVRVLEEAQTVISKNQYDSVEARPAEVIGLDDYIALGIADVKNGNMKMTAQSWLAAIKIKTDWSNKQQTNKTELIKAIYSMSSGDKKKGMSDGTSSQKDAGRDNQGQEQPQTVYGTITGSDTP